MGKVDPRHIKHPRFYTKDGWLTPYALACGYVEQKYYGQIRISLYQDSPGSGLYHVRAYDYERHAQCFWEVFETLTDARRHYRYAEALLVAGKEENDERQH